MAREKLYSGTNSNDEFYVNVDGGKIINLLRHWTTHPGEAMYFAHVSAKRHAGEMVVLALPKCENAQFAMVQGNPDFAINRSERSDWYNMTNEGADNGHDPSSTEQSNIQVYTQSQLENFIEKYSKKKEDEKRWLTGYFSNLQRTQQN